MGRAKYQPNKDARDTCVTHKHAQVSRRKSLIVQALGIENYSRDTWDTYKEKSSEEIRKGVEKNYRVFSPGAVGVTGVRPRYQAGDPIPDHWKNPQPSNPPLLDNGWSKPAWIERLEYLAAACERINPNRAAELRRMAQAVEAS